MSEGISLRSVLYFHKWVPKCKMIEGELRLPAHISEEELVVDWGKLTAAEKREVDELWDAEEAKRRRGPCPTLEH